MIRDPFYRKIVEGLEGRLDPELFEQCASDILRHWHPHSSPFGEVATLEWTEQLPMDRAPRFR